MNYLNNYDNNNPLVDNYETNMSQSDSLLPNEEDNPGFMNYLNNYDNNISTSFEQTGDNYLNNDLANNVQEPALQGEITGNNSYLNNYSNSINQQSENNYLNNEGIDNNVMINNVNPPITTGFDNNSYVENNPNYVDASKSLMIESIDEVINKIKVVVDDIKNNSKYKVDTDEINYDDIYQITIKIDKRDF